MFPAYSGVVDISLVMIAWKLLLGLQMHGVEKIGATVAMSMGVLYVLDLFVPLQVTCTDFSLQGGRNLVCEGGPAPEYVGVFPRRL